METVIDMIGIAQLLGVSDVTRQQWRQRSQKGELWPPLPDPDFPNVTDKPLWYERTVVDWAQRSDRWPAGKAARARGSRRPRSHRTTHEEVIAADQVPPAAA